MAKVATNEKLIGYDTNGKKLITAHFICDSQSDLPVQTEYDDYILYLGCTAHCIAEHTDHELKSGGVWVQTVQPPADYDLLTNRPQINGNVLTGNQSGNDLGLQNTLSFDSTPTQDSANPVTSGGIWTDQQRQDTLQLEDRAALVELIDNSDKNKLQFDGIGAKSGNADNIDFTYNSDGSVTVNGTVDDLGNAYVYLRLGGSNIDAHGTPDFCTGNFVLSGCPENNDGLSLRTTGTGYTASVDTGNGVEINVAGAGITVRIAVFVARNSTINNLTVRPMICTNSAWKISKTHQPYRPSWQELYEMVLALQ